MIITSKDNMVILRDIQEEDIDDYMLWYTDITEWQDWDAPWEKETSTEEELRSRFKKYLQRVKNLDAYIIRSRFEICINDEQKTHIGWVIYYNIDASYKYTKENGLCTIGIDIPHLKYRKHGYGTSALLTYIDYLKSNHIEDIFTQTWSGNQAMIRLSKKIGFIECNRLKDYRTVNGKTYDAITWKLKQE